MSSPLKNDVFSVRIFSPFLLIHTIAHPNTLRFHKPFPAHQLTPHWFFAFSTTLADIIRFGLSRCCVVNRIVCSTRCYKTWWKRAKRRATVNSWPLQVDMAPAIRVRTSRSSSKLSTNVVHVSIQLLAIHVCLKKRSYCMFCVSRKKIHYPAWGNAQ